MFSVLRGLSRVNAQAYVANSPGELKDCAGIVLPGVGSFGYAANALRSRGFFSALRDAAESGVPLLGICLGMQLLFSHSEESPDAEGLGILGGAVTKLNAQGLKLPHIGWSDLYSTRGRLMEGIKSGEFVYFVHSFGVHSDGFYSAKAEYGEKFDASVESGNVFATQFHPEKSGLVGLKILSNFVEICGETEK